jgi:hypothetical protein
VAHHLSKQPLSHGRLALAVLPDLLGILAENLADQAIDGVRVADLG